MTTIETNNIKFTHNGKEREQKYTMKQQNILAVVIALAVCAVCGTIAMVFWKFFGAKVEAMDIVWQVVIDLIFAVVLIAIGAVIVGVSCVKLYGHQRELEISDTVISMSKPKYKAAWFDNELIIRCVYTSGKTEYKELKDWLRYVFRYAEDINLDNRIPAGTPVKIEANMDFDTNVANIRVLSTKEEN